MISGLGRGGNGLADLEDDVITDYAESDVMLGGNGSGNGSGSGNGGSGSNGSAGNNGMIIH